MVPTHIPEPDRTWFTIAAYNVGFGHVEDARIIAQTLGKNPDSWADVSTEMPKLAEPRWFTTRKVWLRAGMAASRIRRARAPVHAAARVAAR